MNGEDNFYTVRTGDTLWALAERFGTTVEQLQEWNNIPDPNKIKVGQRLRVKAGSGMNGEDNFYTVRTGDTLWALAERFGTTVEQLQEWNNIPDPNKIKVGQRLRVP